MSEQFPPAGEAPGFANRDGFDVEEHWVDRVVVVSVSGAVDAFTAPRLTDAIGVAAAKSPTAMIIDLSRVDFLDSSGLSVLIAAHDELAPHAGFGVVADGPATSRPLTLVGFDSLLALYRSLDDALHAIHG